ncbi:hypothetical protein AAIB41_11470 [Brucella sp. BE17]|uniref:hypothetical protein n=1 Tax=Brucella sp. BE17 TaxID=3142977 RepID=UPI0031BAE23F
MEPIIKFSIFVAVSTAVAFGVFGLRYILVKAGYGPQLDRVNAYLEANEHKINAFRFGIGMSLLSGASTLTRAPLIGSKRATAAHAQMAEKMHAAYRRRNEAE